MKLKAFTLYILLLLTLPLSAQQIEVSGSRKAVRTSGDVGAVLLPVAGLTAVLIQKDWEGLKQGAFSALATAGVTYALKYSIRKTAPTIATATHSPRCTPPPRLPRRHSSKGGTAGNGGFRHTCSPPTWAGAGYTARSMTDGTYLPEPPSAPDARTSSPRLPKSIS